MHWKGRYDPRLQMFVQEPREPDLRKLGFLRWLAEQGALEHAVAGPPSGIYASPDPEGRSSEPLVAA